MTMQNGQSLDFLNLELQEWLEACPFQIRNLRQLMFEPKHQKEVELVVEVPIEKTAVMQKVRYEPAEESADEVLEEITGQCSECWDSDWCNSLDVIFDGQLSCSIAIANLGKQIYKLSEDIQLINGCLGTLEDELQKQFREQFYKDQQTTKEVEL